MSTHTPPRPLPLPGELPSYITPLRSRKLSGAELLEFTRLARTLVYAPAALSEHFGVSKAFGAEIFARALLPAEIARQYEVLNAERRRARRAEREQQEQHDTDQPRRWTL